MESSDSTGPFPLGRGVYGSPLTPGTMVTSSIRLIGLLGQGGMGSVWLAEHLRLRSDVVVKFMSPDHALSRESMRRFEREAALAAQAKSPHVVQVFDHGISDFGLPYIAMERLVGEDLGKRIARERCIAPERFADWLKQACAGLGRAHQKGIVHRDIKPENIFLCDEDGEVLVKILDFGIAKSEALGPEFSKTRTGTLMGTAYYMSPEQTLGAKTVDLRTDLWALGVVTFYAVTGTRPFDGDAIGALAIAIAQGRIPRPSERVPGLAPEIDAFMRKALARDPSARFQSARALGDAFAAAVARDTSRLNPLLELATPPFEVPPLATRAPAEVVAQTAPDAARPSFETATTAQIEKPSPSELHARNSESRFFGRAGVAATLAVAVVGSVALMWSASRPAVSVATPAAASKDTAEFVQQVSATAAEVVPRAVESAGVAPVSPPMAPTPSAAITPSATAMGQRAKPRGAPALPATTPKRSSAGLPSASPPKAAADKSAKPPSNAVKRNPLEMSIE